MIKKLKAHLTKLRADLKPMSFEDKVEHLWNYYKEGLVVVVVVVMIIALVATGLTNLRRETLVFGLQVNVEATEEGKAYLTDDLFAQMQGVKRKQEVVLDRIDFGDVADPENVENSYNASMRLLAMVTAEEIDYMLMDEASMAFYASEDLFTDLRDLLPQQLLQELENALYYAQPEEYTESFPAAVNITSLPFVQANIPEKGNVYMTFPATSQHPQAAVEVLRWMMDWEPAA